METYVRTVTHKGHSHNLTVVSGREHMADKLEQWFLEGKSYAINVRKSKVWKSDFPIVIKSGPWTNEFQATLLAEEIGANVHLAGALLEEGSDRHIAFGNLLGRSCINIEYQKLTTDEHIQLVRKMLVTLASLHHGQDDWILVHGDAHPRNFVIKGFVGTIPVINPNTSLRLVDLESCQKFYPFKPMVNGSSSPITDLVELLYDIRRTTGLTTSYLRGLVEDSYLPIISPLLAGFKILDKLSDRFKDIPRPEVNEVMVLGLD